MTHKWDYEHPDCLWEEMPFYIRWPAAVLAVLYFGGALLIPFALMWK